jgi:hypothetical protein
LKRALIGVLLLLLAGCGVVGCGVQPTEPITGTATTGAMLYLIQNGSLIAVLRPTRYQTRTGETLALLEDNPSAAERDLGITTEVPAGSGPFGVERTTITLQVDPYSLSALAAAQIVCTAAIPGPVTLVGGGQVRGSVTCPI